MKGFIVYPTYDIIENKTFVKLFGRLENGQSFVTINQLNPYFFIKKENLKELEKYLSKYKVEETKFKNFNGEEVIKISSENHTELNKLIKYIHEKHLNTYEDDIKPHTRFLIDNNILDSMNIEGDFQTSEKVERVYHEPKLTPVNFTPNLKIISLDIESDPSAEKIFCVGLYSNDKKYKKSFIVSENKLKDAISCKTEADCLQSFKEEIIKLDPDIITGWNMVNFDLKFLQEQFRKHKIQFDIGRTNENPRIRIEDNFFRSSSADIPGRQVLDALTLLKDPFIKEAPSIKFAEFDSYTLEDVSQSLLKEGKLLKGKDCHIEIEKLYNSKKEKEQQKLVDYNLNDCKLVLDILEKTKMIELSIERCQLTGLPLDRLTASIAAFDSLYIREARKNNLVSPTTKYQQKETRIKGGYVKSLESGLYNNVLVLDFKSLYPSIIRTLNIDPSSFIENNKSKEKDVVEAPNGALFKNQEGLLPRIIEKLHQAREKAKKEKREFSSYAIKIIMNSFFGVLASPNCRYFNLDIANAITHSAQKIIKLTAEKVEEKGFKVIYSDTDSVFVETKLNKEKADKLGIEIQDYINDFYKKYIKETYNRTSFLEIQFDKQFIHLLIPKLRGKDGEDIAAKKRYAGLIEKNGKEEIVIVGLEAIRGDWTEAAQDFQKELLNKLFHNEPIESFIKKYIEDIKKGKLDSKLVYSKSIRKNLEEYTKTTPPHVKAARKLPSLEGNVIKYYITTDGPEPIQALKHKLDYEHYIDKQIKPIANQILAVFNKSFEETTEKGKQAKLF